MGAGALDAEDLEEVTIYPTIEPPELTQDWKQTLGGHKQKLVCTRTQEKGAETLQETDPDLPVSVQESLGRRGSAVACCTAGSTECSSACMGPLEGGRHYPHDLHHSLAPGQTTGSEHNPTHEQKIGLKIY